eukprot:NODE_15651_length_1038_cov_12.335895.p1 GENE.NODE_15651_length_1038_cov_12.335895~~NODE_15651_length_1038_cov_12.335895.p1  ORF type:complete len:242 (-),score=63.17 NODE_15651_length_1038_cov_12.335895:223-948(-)
MADDSAKNLYFARLAEQAMMYDDMSNIMQSVVKDGADLSAEDRNLFVVAYKQSVDSRRAARDILSRVEQMEEAKGNDEQARLALEYREKVERELHQICSDVHDLLMHRVLPAATCAEQRVFYQKMRGDYFRYIAESTSGDAKTNAAENARLSYTDAMLAARGELAATDPIRLTVALNFSVLHHEIFGNFDIAREMARGAFQAAADEMNGLGEDMYRETLTILSGLNGNILRWTQEQEQRDA